MGVPGLVEFLPQLAGVVLDDVFREDEMVLVEEELATVFLLLDFLVVAAPGESMLLANTSAAQDNTAGQAEQSDQRKEKSGLDL